MLRRRRAAAGRGSRLKQRFRSPALDVAPAIGRTREEQGTTRAREIRSRRPIAALTDCRRGCTVCGADRGPPRETHECPTRCEGRNLSCEVLHARPTAPFAVGVSASPLCCPNVPTWPRADIGCDGERRAVTPATHLPVSSACRSMEWRRSTRRGLGGRRRSRRRFSGRRGIRRVSVGSAYSSLSPRACRSVLVSAISVRCGSLALGVSVGTGVLVGVGVHGRGVGRRRCVGRPSM